MDVTSLPVTTDRLLLRLFTQRWGSEYIYAALAHELKR